jgi:CSLREA domain-containing protein
VDPLELAAPIACLIVGVLAILLVLAPGQAVLATTINVNTTTDELSVDGNCSLREAIQAANTDTAVDACTAGSGADTIVVPAGTYTLSIPGAEEDANLTGDLDITSDLTINGASTIIQACDSSGGPCTGIDRVFHIVSIEASHSTVTISGVTIRNGSITSGDTANRGDGGGILNDGTLILTNSTVSGSTAGNGGGILNRPGGTATLTNSTVSGNTAIYSGGIFNYGTLTLTNSTVSGNTASDANAGGIFNRSGTLTLTNSTVSGNTASYGPSGIFNVGGAATLKNTIVANGPSGRNCAGVITSLGHNLSIDDTCAFDGAGDLNGTAPMLGPLADNGGSTQTHALLAGSPAIDAGSGDCPPPATDQRGVSRPQDGDGNGSSICDIGAFELEPATPAVLRGDVDCNRIVNSIDAALILQYSAGLLGSLRCAENADTNHDARVNSIDSALILQYVAGLIHGLPA